MIARTIDITRGHKKYELLLMSSFHSEYIILYGILLVRAPWAHHPFLFAPDVITEIIAKIQKSLSDSQTRCANNVGSTRELRKKKKLISQSHSPSKLLFIGECVYENDGQ